MNDTLRTAIARRQLTVYHVAQLAGVEPKAVQRWIGGRVPHSHSRWTAAASLKEDASYHVWGANAYGSPVFRLRQVQGSALFAGYTISFDAVWVTAGLVPRMSAAS